MHYIRGGYELGMRTKHERTTGMQKFKHVERL